MSERPNEHPLKMPDIRLRAIPTSQNYLFHQSLEKLLRYLIEYFSAKYCTGLGKIQSLSLYTPKYFVEIFAIAHDIVIK